MPRYFFDYSEGALTVVDDDGVMFDDMSSAELDAAMSLASMLANTVRRGQSGEISIVVRDENGVPLLRLSVELKRMNLQ